MSYSLCCQRRKEKYEELINNGEQKASFDITDHNGDHIQVRIVRYKGEVWLTHIENGEIMEVFIV